jgi:phospholipase D1/2
VTHTSKKPRRAVFARYTGFGVLTVALLGMAAAWQFTPLKEHLDVASLLEMVRRIQELPLAPLVVIGGYVAASLCMVPITLLIAATGLAFDAVPAIAYGLCGMMLAAAVTFLAGAWLGREAVRKLAGARINRVSKKMADGGIPAVALMRLFPFAPFTVVNVVAGASHIRFRDFLVGTLIGEGPGVVIVVLFANQLGSSLREPSAAGFVTLGVGLILVIALVVTLKRRFSKA